MKMASVLAAVVLLLVAVFAQAGPPTDGVYKSITGAMLVGRFSESWAGGGQGQIGNAVHSMSWNGTALGTQWTVSCPVLAAVPTLVNDSRDASGTGMVEYMSHYAGGVFWLVRTGPWGDGTQDYTGTLDYYTHHTTFVFVNWVPISYTANAEFGGHFDGYCKCITVTANGASVGKGAQPANYPPFLQTDCMPNAGLQGEWGSVRDVILSIYECASSNDPSTWGTIKALYR
jgi:hypothetical protein